MDAILSLSTVIFDRLVAHIPARGTQASNKIRKDERGTMNAEWGKKGK